MPHRNGILDDLDRSLLRLLQEDARRSYRRLATLAGTTTPTAANRVRRMEELGLILGYTVQLDEARFGTVQPDPRTEVSVDLEAKVSVPCHTCNQATTSPVYLNLDGRRHPFCCPTCRRDFEDRYDRISKAAIERPSVR